MTAKAETAALFHRLHEGPEPLLLPNAWDAGSARLMESLGAKAVATTSAAVAWTHGYPDGDVLPVRMLVSSIVAIARAIRVPLTVDVEGGYSDDPAAVEETVARIVEAGAVGINIEDGRQRARPAVPEDRARQAGRPAFRHRPVRQRPHRCLSARSRPRGQARCEVLSRAKLYRNAGASGLFVPGLREPSEIKAVCRRCRPAAQRDGVAGIAGGNRVGSAWRAAPQRRLGIAQALWGKAAALAGDFLKTGKSEPLGEGAMATPTSTRCSARGKEQRHDCPGP
jgi:2-methylisocitrate lyase-like PEP mutase family enzyme